MAMKPAHYRGHPICAGSCHDNSENDGGVSFPSCSTASAARRAAICMRPHDLAWHHVFRFDLRRWRLAPDARASRTSISYRARVREHRTRWRHPLARPRPRQCACRGSVGWALPQLSRCQMRGQARASRRVGACSGFGRSGSGGTRYAAARTELLPEALQIGGREALAGHGQQHCVLPGDVPA